MECEVDIWVELADFALFDAFSEHPVYFFLSIGESLADVLLAVRVDEGRWFGSGNL